jgi:integrase
MLGGKKTVPLSNKALVSNEVKSATILLTLGVHPKVVQELLGHGTIAITMDTYSHLLPSMQKDVADKMNDIFRLNEDREND